MSDSRRRILVATDDRARVERILTVLATTPHEVAVLNSAEALSWLERGADLDLLVVEIEAPEMRGFDVARLYRRLLGDLRPILAISADFKREHIEGMLENLGVQRLFPAEIRPEEMLFWVNHALFPGAMRSRRTPRLPASFVLSIAGEAHVLRGRAFNLSEDGLFLETGLEAQRGDSLEVEFRLPDEHRPAAAIRVRCEVVWANPAPPLGPDGQAPYGIGLRFLDLDETSRQAIKAYVIRSLLDQSI